MRRTRERRKQIGAVPKWGAALLGMTTLTLAGLTIDPAPAAADEISDLKAQIEALSQRVTQMEAKRNQAGAANVVVGGDQGMDKTLYAPGSFKLPGTDTSVSIHGYVKTDFNYDFQTTGFENVFVPAAFAEGADHDGQFNAHVQESRVNIVTTTPTDAGQLMTRFEVDFFAAGQNANNPFEIKTNGFDLGLRHAYAKLGNLLVGQDWSTYQDLAGFAATIDFSGGNATSFVRQPMVQWSQPFGNGSEWAISLENPFTDVTIPTGSSATATEQIPDIAARIQTTQPWGHLWLSGVARFLTVSGGGGDGGDDTAFGGGFYGVAEYNVGERDRFTVIGQWGDGVGRYQNDLGYVGGLGGVYNPATGDIETVEAWTAGAHFTHWWTGALRSTAYYGYSEADTSSPLFVGSTYEKTQMAVLNLVWSPIPQVNTGIEFLWGERENKDGVNLPDQRIQTSAQFLF